MTYYFAFQCMSYLLAIAFALHLSSRFHGVPIFLMTVVVILILSPFALHLSSGFHGVPIFPMIVVVILILSPFVLLSFCFF